MRYNYYNETCGEGETEIRCLDCGARVECGEAYIQSENGNLCAACADEMEIFDILSLLELDSVIELVEIASNKVKYK